MGPSKSSRMSGKKPIMVAPEPYLKTRQVADALGVSVSTIKRWVDSGDLEATRTMGRHRLVLLSDAVDFARRQNLPVAGLLHRQGPGSTEILSDDQVRSALLASLQAGDAGESRRLIRAAHRVARGGDGLADRFIQPVLAAIGQGWMVGSWEIYQERQATRMIALAVHELSAGLEPASAEGRPLALGGTIGGDHYSLPGVLGELVLREAGWDVANLGCDLPLRSFARAIRDRKPGLVYLPISHVADRSGFVRDYAYFYEAATLAGSAIILGGRALDPDLRSKLVYASFGDRMVHLAEFARRLLPTLRATGGAELGHPA